MLLRDLQRASFRGVPFLVPSDETSEGRTTLDHLYPDSNFRYAEDNGGIPPKFKISAIVAEPNLPAKLRALRNALTAQGPGTLKHPWCGSQFVQVDGDYSIKRSDKTSGHVELEIKFLVTGPPQFPRLASGIAAVVTGLRANSLLTLFAEFKASLQPALSHVSFELFTTAIVEAGEQLAASFRSASPAPDRIVRDAGILAADPERLGTLFVESISAAFDDDTISEAALVEGFVALVDIGAAQAADAEAIQPTTIDLSQRRLNMALLAATIETAGFLGLCEAVAGRKYLTADDVERDEVRVTERYEAIQGRDLAVTVRDALREIYVATSEVLRDSIVRLPRIVALDVGHFPASVLAYLLYEDKRQPSNVKTVENRVTTLVALNLEQTPLLLTGETDVVMQET